MAGVVPTVAQTTIAKGGWAAGPWQAESDIVSFAEPSTRYPVLLNRDTGGGHWLVYAGVPPGHVAYGVTDPTRIPVGAQGGLSYAGPLSGGDTTWWWVGFSCGAASGLQPLTSAGTAYLSQAQAAALGGQLALDLKRLANLGSGGVSTVASPPPVTTTPSSSASSGSTSPSVSVGINLLGVSLKI